MEESDFVIHTFTITELETIHEVVEEQYLEKMILDMAGYIIGNGSNTDDAEI